MELQGHDVLAASHLRAASSVVALRQIHSFVDLIDSECLWYIGAVRAAGPFKNIRRSAAATNSMATRHLPHAIPDPAAFRGGALAGPTVS